MGKKKSKPPRGRAAAKKKAQKGASNGVMADGTFMFGSLPRSARQALENDDDDDSFLRFKGFAQGKRDFTPRDPAVKFRHQAISFVSASTNTPADTSTEQRKLSEEAVFVAAEDSGEEEEEDEDEFDNSAIQSNLLADTDVEISEHAIADLSVHTTQNITLPQNHDRDLRTGSSVESAVHLDLTRTSDAPLFVIDTMGDPNLAASAKMNGKKPVRPSTPLESDSSGEEVVFRGRAKPKTIMEPIKPQVSSSSVPMPQQAPRADGFQSKPQASSSFASKSQQAPTSNGIQATPNGWSSSPNGQPAPAKGWAAKKSQQDSEVNLNSKWAPAPAGAWWKKGQPEPDFDPSPAEKKAIDETPRSETKVMFVDPQKDASTSGPVDANTESAETTIESLQADWKATLRTKNSAKKSLKKPNRHGKRGRKTDNRHLRALIESDDELDESAYDDYMQNLADQLDDDDSNMSGDVKGMNGFASVNIDGPSLVVNGEEIGEDEVLDQSHLNEDDTSSESSGPIGQDRLDDFTSDDDDDDNNDDNDSDIDSSELEETLEYTEQEQWEDEEDLRQRRYDQKTDEQLARLLAKQEELGIDGDEIIIDDGYYDGASGELDGIGDIAAARAGLADFTNFTSGRLPNKHGMRRNRNRGNDNFPDASLLADTVDQYGQNGFDIMDFDRPSLRPKKKGRKGRLPPELEALSDDELKEDMAESWDADRAKKRLKKAEREDLRRQGLLGAAGRKGKADLGEKYVFGITQKQIFEEVRVFMQNDGQKSLPMPPMDKHERKALHDVANVLNLKSKSVGMGTNRFPVLYKTRFSVYNPETFDKTVDFSKKGLLDRDTKYGKKYANKNMKKSGKLIKGPTGGVNAATIRNGEVVGAGAAEISTSSFGHKMMEKMGWSKGMALGRDGEGILKPVEQVMRAGKAGLG